MKMIIPKIRKIICITKLSTGGITFNNIIETDVNAPNSIPTNTCRKCFGGNALLKINSSIKTKKH